MGPRVGPWKGSGEGNALRLGTPCPLRAIAPAARGWRTRVTGGGGRDRRAATLGAAPRHSPTAAAAAASSPTAAKNPLP